jgi:predicted nucleic acid-binding protein
VTIFVVDASVAGKWMLPAEGEPFRAEAFRVLDGYGAGEIDLRVPDIFWAECGNILWKAVRQRRLSRTDAELALGSMMRLDFQTFPSKGLVSEALPIAFRFGRAIYDCLYVALAMRSKTEMITADEGLANALAAHLPVKWLGSVGSLL